MNRHLTLLVMATVLVAAVVGASQAAEPYQYKPTDNIVFNPVLLAAAPSRDPTIPPMVFRDPQVFGPAPPGSVGRPEQTLRTAPKSESRPTAHPSVIPPVTERYARGKATWYCLSGRSSCHYKYPDRPGVLDMYAAAGGEIRSKGWRGRTVTVCSSGRCIRVKLVDWCACGGANAIDLYADAFRELVDPNWRKLGHSDPLGRGRVSVRILWN